MELEYPKSFVNQVVHADLLEAMKFIPNESIDLVITSPPYFNLREYSNWKTYEDYLLSVDDWFSLLSQKIKPGRYIFWNIQDSYPNRLFDKMAERKHLPISSDTIQAAKKYLNYEGNIIWFKGLGGATQRMFGSYPYPPTLIISWLHENILVFRKPGKAIYTRNKESKLSQNQWVSITNSVWQFNPKTNSEHPAPFPEELPNRIIIGWSFTGDIVLDPFLGSGTTAISAKKLKRNFIGIELNEEYCKLAEAKIKGVTQPLF